MQLTVRLFASLREEFGFQEKSLAIDKSVSTGELWSELFEVEPPANLLCAVNHAYADMDTLLHDGDEVGFFPPVNGG